jgi:hypothetical protein
MGSAAGLTHTRRAQAREILLRYGRGFELLAALLFLATKLTLFWGRHPAYTGDKGVFARLGTRPLTDITFWTATRPFTTPLFHKLSGGNAQIVIWLQGATGAVAWLALAHALSRLVPGKWASRALFVLLLGLALTTGVHGWDFIVRSESLSNSFLALTLAALLNALRHAAQRDRRRAGAWSAGCVVAAVFAAGARDTNAYVLAGFALLVVWGAWFARRERPWLVLGALVLGLLVVAAGSRKNAQLSGRHRTSLTQVVFQRVLTHPRRLAYFRDRLGMPTSKVLLGRKGTMLSSDDYFAKKSPALARFREWVANEGYYAYQRYLLTHLGSTFREAMRRFPAEAGNSRKKYTRRGENSVSRRLDFLIMRSVAWRPWFSAAFAVGVGLLAVSFGRKRGLHWLGAVTLCAVGTAIVQGYVSYHGDAMEVSRHSLNVALFLQLAVVCAVVTAGALAAAGLERARPDPVKAG